MPLSKYIFVSALSIFCVNTIKADESVHTEELPFDMDYDKRTGIIAFQEQEYTKAIFFLEQYFKRQPQDEVAVDFLYGSYLYANRTEQAKAIFPYLSEYNQSLYKVKPKPLAYAYAEGGRLGKKIMSETETEENSYFYYPDYNTGIYGLIELGHNLTPCLSYKHHFSFYTIDGIQKAYSKDVLTDFELDERQLSYSGYLEYNLPTGWTFGLCGAYFNDRYNTIRVKESGEKKNETKNETKAANDYWNNQNWNQNQDQNQNWNQNQDQNQNWNQNQDWNQNWNQDWYQNWYWNQYQFWNQYNYWNNNYSFTTSTTNELEMVPITEHSYAVEVNASKSFDWIYPDIHFSYANASHINIFQPKILFTIFPFRNTKLFGTTVVADIIYDHSNNFIFEEKIGGEVAPWLWLEVSYANGNMRFYNENNFVTFYTMLYKSKHRASVNAFFPINSNLGFNLMYRLMTKENSYIVTNYDGGETVYTQKSNSHNIIGGVKWTF